MPARDSPVCPCEHRCLSGPRGTCKAISLRQRAKRQEAPQRPPLVGTLCSCPITRSSEKLERHSPVVKRPVHFPLLQGFSDQIFSMSKPLGRGRLLPLHGLVVLSQSHQEAITQ